MDIVNCSLNDTRLVLENSQVITLRLVDIGPVENGSSVTLADGSACACVTAARYPVLTLFQVEVSGGACSILVVKKDFASDDLAMRYVLGLFDMLQEMNIASRDDVAGWRRDLLVAV